MSSETLLLIKLVEYSPCNVFQRHSTLFFSHRHVGQQTLGCVGPEAFVSFLLADEFVIVIGLPARMIGHLQLVSFLVIAPIHHLSEKVITIIITLKYGIFM